MTYDVNITCLSSFINMANLCNVDNTTKLIAKLENRPALYDPTDVKYTNESFRRSECDAIGDLLGTTVKLEFVVPCKFRIGLKAGSPINMIRFDPFQYKPVINVKNRSHCTKDV